MGLGFFNIKKSTVNLVSSCRDLNDLWTEFESSAEGISTSRVLKWLCTVLGTVLRFQFYQPLDRQANSSWVVLLGI